MSLCQPVLTCGRTFVHAGSKGSFVRRGLCSWASVFFGLCICVYSDLESRASVLVLMWVFAYGCACLRTRTHSHTYVLNFSPLLLVLVNLFFQVDCEVCPYICMRAVKFTFPGYTPIPIPV